MTIEFVDSEVIEDKNNSYVPKPPVSEIAAKAETRERPKRLVGLDEKLGESLVKLESHCQKMHDLNTRLFGSDKNNSDGSRGKSSTQNGGLVLSLDAKVDELHALLTRIDSEIKTLDSLA